MVDLLRIAFREDGRAVHRDSAGIRHPAAMT
jgi:hypothetical protein